MCLGAKMSSKVRFVSPPQIIQPAPALVETDWTKCVICQEDKNEKLLCPADSKKKCNVGAGYVSLAEDLTAFGNAGCLSKHFDILRVNDGDGIETTLQRHRAKFHNICRLEYSKTRLQRAMKRKSTDGELSTSNDTKKPCRQHHSRQQNRTTESPLCLFCEKPASPSDPLHEAMTKMVSERVKRCATKILDERLLAKVSSGDLIASEAKYHAKCLVALYNAAARSKTSEQNENNEGGTTEKYYARAFAELLEFIEDTLADRNQTPVFKLSDLVRLYRDRLTQLSVSSPCVHSTRLKDRILANFPELHAFKEGRDILLISNKDVGTALRQACENDADDDAYILAQAARIVRKEILNSTTQFSGTFSENCQVEAVPLSLQTLVAMICHGTNITEQSLVTQRQAILSICQLIVFNSLAHSGKQTQATRHNKSREPPLPVYLGVLLHTKTRKRALVEVLYDLGLSVSYDRVLEISTDVGTKICKYYDKLNTVCPPQLKKAAFTTSAVDNINHQTSSTTAKSSFNGTGISVFQHFSSTDETTSYESVMPLEEPSDSISEPQTNPLRKKLPRLPLSYIQVPPVTQSKLSSSIPSVNQPMMTECPLMTPAIQLEYR